MYYTPWQALPSPRWSRSGPVRYGCQICVPFRSTPFPSHCSRGFTASKSAPTARSDTVEAVERFIVYIRSYGAQRTVVTPSERFPSLQSSVHEFGIFRGLVFASVDYSVFFFMEAIFIVHLNSKKIDFGCTEEPWTSTT